MKPENKEREAGERKERKKRRNKEAGRKGGMRRNQGDIGREEGGG